MHVYVRMATRVSQISMLFAFPEAHVNSTGSTAFGKCIPQRGQASPAQPIKLPSASRVPIPGCPAHSGGSWESYLALIC